MGGFLGVIADAGVYQTSIRVTDSTGAFFDKITNVTILDFHQISQTTPPRPVVGTLYDFAIDTIGVISPTWSASVTSSPLPPGLSVNGSGHVVGTPTTAGTYNSVITVTDTGRTGNPGRGVTYTFVVNPFAITTNGQLADGTFGVFYSQTIQAPGCPAPCTFTTNSGLPAGLSLSSSGVLSGTPNSTTSGQAINVTVTGSGNATSLKTFSLRINNAGIQPLRIDTGPALQTNVGGVAAFTLNASGGTQPYTWSVEDGPLPTGIDVEGPGETIGGLALPGFRALAGRVMTPGQHTFTVKVTDANGLTSRKPMTWNVTKLAHSYLNFPQTGVTTPLPAPVYGTPYTQALLGLGGTRPYTWTPLTPMPGGLTINSSTGVVSGTPAFIGTQSVTVELRDAAGNVNSSNLNFTVAGVTATTLSFSLGANQTVTQGASFSQSLGISGGTGPYTVEALTALPPGFALLSGSSSTSQDGALLLAGTAITAGVFPTTIRATDSLGNIGVRTYVFTVTPMSFVTGQLKIGAVGALYDDRLLVVGGTAPVTFSLQSGFSLPAGLTMNKSGRIRGTPEDMGSYSINFIATDALGATVNRSFTLTISNISFTGPDILPTAIAGQSYNYVFTATGGINPVTFNTGFMPAGLTLAPNGTISGTVESGWDGFYTLFVNATDGLTLVQRRFTIFVVPQTQGIPSLFVTPTTLADLVVGQASLLTLGTPEGGVGPFTWSVASGSTLPPGLNLVAGNRLPASINPGTTLLAGAPTTAGTFTFRLVATDANGVQMARTYTLHVSRISMLSVNGTKNPRIGEAYAFQLVTVGGTAPYTYSTTRTNPFNPMLPPGVTISPGGLFSGTPTSTGNYTVRVTVTDSTGQTFSRNITLSVFDFVNGGAGGLMVNTGTPADISAGIYESYFFGLSRQSGSAPAVVNWTVVGGALPPGMNLVVCCGGTYLYGGGSTPGTYTFRMRGTNAANPAEFAERDFTYVVSPMQIVSPPVNLFQRYLPPAQVGTPYSTTIRVAGGTRPYTFSLTRPGDPASASLLLPRGLTLSAGGVLSGTPEEIGDYNIWFYVTDASGSTFAVAAENVLLTVTPAGGVPPLRLAEDDGDAIPATLGVEFALGSLLSDFFIQGGVKPFTWTVSAGSLPPGMALVNGSNGVPNAIVGKPTLAGEYEFTLEIQDAAGQHGTTTTRIAVSDLGFTNPKPPNGVVGSPYSFTLTPTGGMAPYTITANEGLFEGGGMPPGLTLNSAGLLSGTPTAPGNFVIPAVLADSMDQFFFVFYRVTIDNPQGHAKAVSLSPQVIEVSHTQGAPGATIPLSVNITNGSPAFTAGISGIPGATLSVTSGNAPATIDVNLNLAALAEGTYHGMVGVNVPGAANLFDTVPIAITVGPPPIVNAISVTPNAGAGVSQTFTFAYSDSAGVTADLNAAQVRFSNVLNPALTCVIHYRATTNTIRMQDDAGVFGAYVPMGSGSLSNSRCAVNLASSNATPNGTDLSLALNTTFLGPMSGPATIGMRANSAAGPTTGWVARGTFTVGAVLGVGPVSPNTGTGMSQTFTATFSDSLGVAADLKSAQVRIGSGNVGSCVVQYNAMTNQIRILDDAGAAMGWVDVGTNGSQANSQCTLDLTNTSALRSGTDLTLTLRLLFDPTYLGTKTVALRANSNFGTTTTGFITQGSWTVGAVVNPVAVSPNAGSSSVNAGQNFTFTYSDSEGVATDLKGAKVRFSGTNGTRCLVDYNATTQMVRMQNDGGTWSAFVPLGSAITGWSTMCDVDTSSATPSGNDLSLTLRLIFKAPFVGDKTTSMRADSNIMGAGTWTPKGTWTVTP